MHPLVQRLLFVPAHEGDGPVSDPSTTAVPGSSMRAMMRSLLQRYGRSVYQFQAPVARVSSVPLQGRIGSYKDGEHRACPGEGGPRGAVSLTPAVAFQSRFRMAKNCTGLSLKGPGTTHSASERLSSSSTSARGLSISMSPRRIMRILLRWPFVSELVL